MRIISDFRDYYDRHYPGSEKEVVYARRTRQVDNRAVVSLVDSHIGSLPRNVSTWTDRITPGFLSVLFVAGRAHPFYRVTGEDGIDYTKRLLSERRWWGKDDPTQWERLLEADCSQVNIVTGSPIVLASTRGSSWYRPVTTLQADVSLRDLSFSQVLGADECYQRIDTFLSERMAAPDPPSPVSEKDRLLARGFDPKWSFRNPLPPKRKRGI